MSLVSMLSVPRMRRPGWILPLVIFDTAMKAFAARRALRNRHRGWALALIVTNTVGVLPAVYLAFFQRPQGDVDGEEAS